MKKTLLLLSFYLFSFQVNAQQSVARIWNEMQLNAIRIDAARPPVQARNLFHVSMAMYDAWAAYDNNASTYILGKTINSVTYPFTGVPTPASIEIARNKAISYAAYRVLINRYSISPNWITTSMRLDSTMNSLGYNIYLTGTNYTSGNPEELGNYIAAQVISMGYGDGANQTNNYAGTGYSPGNSPLLLMNSGNATMTNVNRWQPLTYVTCIDQNGNPCGSSTPSFVCPLWGKVLPFSMPTSTAVHNTRNGIDYPMYFDPGTPPQLNLANGNDSSSQILKWGHSMVLSWSSHLDPSDTTTWDISPNGKGNVASYPTTIAGQQAFYDFNNGFTQLGSGYALNPVTNLSYAPQLVKRGDYTRIVSQYWADGPTSETPPGHWFVLLNHASDYPGFQKKIGGVGPICPDLEWDIKSYFTLGATMHDAAIACWGIKGWYDSPRPISMIRKMAAYGQSSNFMSPNYNPAGIALIPGYIEQVTLSDPAVLRGVGNVNLNKIKVKAWRGFSSISFSGTVPNNAAGVGWILAENWMPYQRETFVTPPFAGYTSGHSTYSRAGALSLTNLTGSPFFPGGLYEYTIPANSNFIGFEKSPVNQIKLQYASYKDASDEASVSRIWGGIHPPFDDMPARLIGEEIGNETYLKAKTYFDNQVMSAEIVSNLMNPICEGSMITFSASVSNPPLNAVYTWKKNGVVMAVGATDTYSLSSYLTNDKILCEVSGAGYIVSSNEIEIQTTNCSLAALNLKLYLQGYYSAPNTMELALANQGVGSSGTLTDSITVELHETTLPYAVLETQKVGLNSDGTASCLFSSGAGAYFIAIKHRSSITTWSAAPVSIGTSTPYNFTLSASSAYGNNLIEVESGIWAIYAGDIVADENIDLLDLSLLENDINQFLSGYYPTDLNGDGNIDLLDAPILENNIGNFIFAAHP